MKTITARFGPRDHGRQVSDSEAEQAEYVGGYKYELIDGRLYVSPLPNLPEHRLERWMRIVLDDYAFAHPEVINFVAVKGRVFLPEAVRTTVPEPDVAAYANFPEDSEVDEVEWEQISPLLVVEILVGGSIEKDLGRNPPLYHAVPSIREYWVIDGSENPREPSLIHHRRRGKRWAVTTHPFDSVFTTDLLPGFKLRLNPKSRRRK